MGVEEQGLQVNKVPGRCICGLPYQDAPGENRGSVPGITSQPEPEIIFWLNLSDTSAFSSLAAGVALRVLSAVGTCQLNRHVRHRTREMDVYQTDESSCS